MLTLTARREAPDPPAAALPAGDAAALPWQLGQICLTAREALVFPDRNLYPDAGTVEFRLTTAASVLALDDAARRAGQDALDQLRQAVADFRHDPAYQQ